MKEPSRTAFIFLVSETNEGRPADVELEVTSISTCDHYVSFVGTDGKKLWIPHSQIRAIRIKDNK